MLNLFKKMNSFGLDEPDEWTKMYRKICEDLEKMKDEETCATNNDVCDDKTFSTKETYINKVWDNGKLTHSEERETIDGKVVKNERFDAVAGIEDKTCCAKKKCEKKDDVPLCDGKVKIDVERYEQLVMSEKNLKDLRRDFVKLNDEVEKLRKANKELGDESIELEKENKELKRHMANVATYLRINGFDDNRKGFINV